MAEFRIRQIIPGRPAESGDELDSMLSELLASDADAGLEGTTEEATIPVEDAMGLLSQSQSSAVSETFPHLLDRMRAELLETESETESPLEDMLSELLSETMAERPNAEGTTEEELPEFIAETVREVEDAIALLSQPQSSSDHLNNEPVEVKAAQPFPYLLEPREAESEAAGKASLELHFRTAQVLPAYTAAPRKEPPREDTLSELPRETMAERTNARPSTPAQVEQVRELDELIAAIDDDARSTPFDSEVTPVELRHTGEVTSRWVIFSLARTKYAMPIGDVIETDKVPRITAVPNMPPFVRGISNLRGDIISVLDLGVLLGLEYSEQVEHGRILVVRGGQERTLTAFVVDDVKGMATVSERQITQVAGQIEDRVVPVLRGVFEHEDQLVNLLNVERLFASDELQRLEFN